jgi:hypothetical protein
MPLNERIFHQLDGEGSCEELSLEERAALAALQAAIVAVAGPLLATRAPDLSTRVMARVTGLNRAPSRLERLAAATRLTVSWLWMPHPLTIRLRPVYAVAALGIIAFGAGLVPLAAPSFGGHGVQMTAAEPATGPVYVQFRLEAAGASHVALVGSFNGWQPVHEMNETTPGVWSIMVPLRPGIHDYAFVVDRQEWIGDPHAFQVGDGFGGTNSRLALAAPAGWET